MFVYLIIAIELAVLYVVFWIVFLREPKPREIRAELWGNYFNPANRSVNNTGQPEKPLIDEEQLDFYLPSVLPSPRVYRSVKMKKMRRKRIMIRRASKSHLYCQSCSRSGHSQYAHRQATLAQRASRTVVERFLLSLNKVLNKLSVKVP
jgi:hypothetical protein